MLRTALLALVLSAPFPSLADSPLDRPRIDAKDLRARVEQHVRDLDAPSRSVRAAARDALIKLGPSVLPLLAEDQAVASAAVRDALGSIRQRLEQQAALSSLAPARVTLRGKMRLRTALDQIAKQSGNSIDSHHVDAARLGKEIVVADKGRPFWSAIDDVVRRSGLAYAGINRDKQIELVSASRGPHPRDISVADNTAFRVAVASATQRTLFEDLTKRSLRVEWTLTAEPRLRPLFARVDGSDLFVRAPNAVLLKPVSPKAKLEISLAEGAQGLRLDTDFDLPQGIETSLIEFGGSVHVEMAVGPRRFVFGELGSGKPQTQRAGEVTVKLRKSTARFQKSGTGAVQIELAITYARGGAAFESFRNWVFNNEVALETRDGRRVSPQPIFSTDRQDDGAFVVGYNFADLQGKADDYRLVYVAPILIVDFPVEFRMASIPVVRSQ